MGAGSPHGPGFVYIPFTQSLLKVWLQFFDTHLVSSLQLCPQSAFHSPLAHRDRPKALQAPHSFHPCPIAALLRAWQGWVKGGSSLYWEEPVILFSGPGPRYNK